MTVETEVTTTDPSNEDLSAMLDHLMGTVAPAQEESGQDSAPAEDQPADTQVQDTVEVEAEPVEAEPEVEQAPEKQAQDELAVEDRAEFLKQINELSAELARLKAGAPVEQKVEPSLQPPVQPAPAPVTSLELTEDDYSEALTSKEGMAKLLGKVHSLAVQQTMSQLPSLVQSVTAQQIAMNNMVTDFYRKNEDLAPYKDFVAHMATQVSSQHPEWAEAKVMEELPKVVREKLRLSPTAKAKAVNKKPALINPNPQVKSQAVPKKETLEDEINKLLGIRN